MAEANKHIGTIVNTALHSGKPLSPEEQRKHTEEQAEITLDSLLDYSKHNRQFAETMCRKVADAFGPDDKLSGILLKRLKIDRVGKPKGPNKKHALSWHQLIVLGYEKQMEAGKSRAVVLERIAHMANYTGDLAIKRAEKLVTKARKECKKSRNCSANIN